MLRELFATILNNYVNDTLQFNSVPSPRNTQNYASFEALTGNLPQQILNRSNLDPLNYKIKGSSGNGNIAAVPHICVFDLSITNSAQQGYYIVYLFDATMSSVYLSLNQGWTQYEQNFSLSEARIQIRTNANKARTYLRSTSSFDFLPINLRHNGKLAKGYELANICSKRYDLSNLPTDAGLIDDLRNLVGVYRELKGLVGESILNIAANLSENDYQNASQGLHEIQESPSLEPQVRRELQGRNPVVGFPRDATISAHALKAANYRCENAPEHVTFTHSLGHNFMEAHHLVPLAFQDDFDYSLDVISNIVCLCPNCHRAFHLATRNIKYDLVNKFLDLRASALTQQGINITLKELQRYYQAEEYQIEII